MFIADNPTDPSLAPDIVVTASRDPVEKDEAPASVTVLDQRHLDRLHAPFLTDLLREVPSLAVAVSGPSGSLSEVRIRGAEADQTLLFVDGIKANDPASGNAPRFELVNADLLSRVEVVRGPQSALWGSEAIGGVIAVDGPTGGATVGMAEIGSFGERRGAARVGIGNASTGLSLGIAGQRATGIDSFNGLGDKDGYSNLSLRASGRWRASDTLAVAASAFRLAGVSQFDGYDPVTFLHADTKDESRDRLTAGRVAATVGDETRLYATASASLLASRNAYYLADVFQSEARAKRRMLGLQAGATFGEQHFILAADDEHESFDAFIHYVRDHRALTAEWRGKLGPLVTDAALRLDMFNRAKDATSVRAAAQLPLTTTLRLAATYGEGIAQPTFYDLFGYPGYSAGNPSLKPERSRGGEVSLRWAQGPWTATLTGWKQNLTDEIVPDYGGAIPSTMNGGGISHRRGVEFEGGWSRSDRLRVSASAAWLHADQPADGGGSRIEYRRPAWSGHVAADGRAGRWSYGALVAYTGPRRDFDFDAYQEVRLGGYWLAGGRLAYRLTRQVELGVRVANAFDARYEDVVGYRTEGRSIHVGLRVGLPD
ncbi:TonB-dependent receptor [Sphingomonas sp. ASV193]|uniref:TonB-dependent receptor plug domain-containing protein n=1 Tax=Sphingomonas sp. ASV193 TaxID=3144405 RepID=UPI0032E87D21